MSDFPVLYCVLEFTQTHVHGVSDAIQPSHPLLSPLPPLCVCVCVYILHTYICVCMYVTDLLCCTAETQHCKSTIR